MTYLQSQNRGAALTLAVLMLTAAMILVVGGVMFPALHAIRSAHEFTRSEDSFFHAEGLLEDVLYRMREDVDVDTLEVFSESGRVATATVTAVGTLQEIVSRGERLRSVRKVRALLDIGSGGAVFNFGIQAGDGGVDLDNNASVIGNVYSNGPIVGEGLNDITGSAVSASTTGLIDDIHTGADAFAHMIKDSLVDGDAYYQIITGTTVTGTPFDESPDQATSTLPISDAMVADWEADAVLGGTLVCNSGSEHKITSDTTLGPVKIPCDLEISGNTTITLRGVVWVEGDMNVQNNSIIRVDPSLGAKSVPIIADKPSSPLTKGKVILQNHATFQGSGVGNSYVLVLSQHASSGCGGTPAIDAKNFATGDLLVYAGHGEVLIEDNINLKEVTANCVHAKNSAQVVYEGGLATLLFVTGPSGGYIISSWREEE
ncbi:MAG: hypothetical protein Q8R39_04425 [bacterium]|nr:hypothetical protein [bacterium]MDZ4284566.1 hypothetical protein [Patescibacteria group bacterium]